MHAAAFHILSRDTILLDNRAKMNSDYKYTYEGSTTSYGTQEKVVFCFYEHTYTWASVRHTQLQHMAVTKAE